MIDCLKKSGLEIKDIKQFMDWTKEGNETFQVRKELFEQQAVIVQEEIEKLEKVQEMIKFKMWYYEEALKKGDEALVQAQIPDDLPDAIKQFYDNSHQ